MDYPWLIGAYLLGSLCVRFLGHVDCGILKAKNSDLEKENKELRAYAEKLSYNLENSIKASTIEVLESVIKTLQNSITKETK